MPAKTHPMRLRQDLEQGSGALALWRYVRFQLNQLEGFSSFHAVAYCNNGGL